MLEACFGPPCLVRQMEHFVCMVNIYRHLSHLLPTLCPIFANSSTHLCALFFSLSLWIRY
uniref:Uncharacterized protein n=1 Tax=Triticum urartu TaxID=4572 RepID=A0A8R7K2F6_TRIUA